MILPKSPKALAKFIGFFALCYGLLIVPWPGWNDFYSSGYRTVGNAVFSHLPGNAIIQFEKNTAPLRPNLSSTITIGNRTKMDYLGRLPVTILQADTRSLAWIPTALLISLILATPVSWQRKIRNTSWGLLAIHFYILIITAIWIINRSSTVSLVNLSGWPKDFTTLLEYTFIEQLGASFVVPVLIWLVVTFFPMASEEEV